MSSRLAPLVIVLIPLLLVASTSAEEADFTPLFDGESFNGWEGNLDVFRIEEGAIIAGNAQASLAHNEFLCTKKIFRDFELRLEAKLVGPGNNAGIQFRSSRIPNDPEVRGYQCDMGAAGDMGNIWGWLYDESRRNKFLAQSNLKNPEKYFREGDWNKFVIRCQGPRIQIWRNGKQTVDYLERDEEISRHGIIGLQIHGGPPSEASYRKIRIRTLTSKK